MRLQRFAACGVVLLLGSITPGTAHAASSEQQLPRFQAKNLARKAPAFVPADQVAQVQDPVAAELLEKGDKHSLDWYREGYRREAGKAGKPARVSAAEGTTLPPFSPIPLEECQVFVGPATTHWPNPKPHESFADLMTHAGAIFSGEIVGISQGFYFGSPASLLKVEVGKQLRSSTELTTPRHYYIVYPVAAFQIRGEPFCASSAIHTYRPEVGNRILVFDYYAPVDVDGVLISPVREALFFEDRGGSLVTPTRLRRDPALYRLDGFDALVDTVEQGRE